MGRKTVRHWFTFFFIPIFPISKSRSLTQCPQCGAQFSMGPQDLRQRIESSDRQQNQQAITLYNSLRASPANSIALDQLMKMYATMQAYDQAVAAASDFPQALHNSEQCMTTLGRVYLAQNKFNEATQWLSSAVERNPQLGEGQYYKALGHLLSTPPDYPAAITAARAARSAGYPQAEALLQQAEAKSRE
jgi:tetratricopeptide (TPR) repeat protein